MGAKDSKRACLSYEDAVKRVSDTEYRRVCEAFKRLSGGSNTITKDAFLYDVLGECVPTAVAELLYNACGGTPRGIALRDLLCGLVLLTLGTQEEKIKFLWSLYCNESGSWITKSDFSRLLKKEQPLRCVQSRAQACCADIDAINTLFGLHHDRVNFEQFRVWLTVKSDGTGLSKWLLVEQCVSLSSELEMPTFYQTLAGVTHLEEQDILELEKCFWTLQSGSPTGQLDSSCVLPLVSPPIPQSACAGLFLALDENRDGHIDFKELCCGVSAACRGPTAERMKFCFKVFDVDRDGKLNANELHHMAEVLSLVSSECETASAIRTDDILASIASRLTDGALSQEEFLIWGVEDNCPSQYFLDLLFEICHIALGLRPQCRHNEHDIVTRWLAREERRGYRVGQFWYLISSSWWRSWSAYTSSKSDTCLCRPVEEGIACDESFTSNSTESMGDLLGRGETSSLASSSGVSSSSGCAPRKASLPGPIDNSSLVAEQHCKVTTLTGEGGRLKRNSMLAQHRDFELVPDSLWKALALWYGGPLPLPRQVILPPGSSEVDLELYPLNLRILRHQPMSQQQTASVTTTWGGYGSQVGLTTNVPPAAPRRSVAHTAAFSRLACVRQVTEFLAQRLSLRIEDLRLWHVPNNEQLILLEDENISLQELGICDDDQLLLEIRNKDLTWPEELGALCTASTTGEQRRVTSSPPPGATGLHNLGNTCFMNAALQAVSNTRPLSEYFSRDGQLRELNCSNPLGTRGQLARRYAELCKELWAGGTRSVAPLKLRWCVTKHAPHLAGGGQHDSQELLAWLLDALHEDLNRVAVSPYSELRDSAGRPDWEVAREAWDQHLARNRSIVIDLFHGQLKSKVTCQSCGHESVRFDPFSMLSLPLPMESFTLCEILVIRLDASVPIKYGLRLNSESTYSEVKDRLKSLCNIEPDRMLLAEVANSQVKSLPNDTSKLRQATVIDLFAYEMPSRIIEDTKVTSCQPRSSIQLDKNFNKGSGSNRCCMSSRPSLQNGDSIAVNEVTTEPLGQNYTAAEPTPAEVRWNTTLCMPNLFCFKSVQQTYINKTNGNNTPSGQVQQNSSANLSPPYVAAIHRKMVRQEAYFLSQHKCKPSIFGVPLLIGCNAGTTCQEVYEAVWAQVTRLLSPLPQSDQTNHATDCDDSLGYEFPFTLCAVSTGGRWCALCPWNKFCRGCRLPCETIPLSEACRTTVCDHELATPSDLCIAIDWDQTALHLRYQSSREKVCIEHDTVAQCRRKHTEPIDLDHCLRAFTTEERLEAKYHCSSCKSLQPATKKLQIWRLPPILIVHLKRFDCVNGKWVKTQKVVNFPFKDFDPTSYLASVPQETILRHRELFTKRNNGSNGTMRERLESTSLSRTPVDDEDLQDFHQHKLNEGQSPFDLKYQLYAVVSHSGMLNGGHYICYACNPNGSWYCYNDSSCREVAHANASDALKAKIPAMDTSSAYILFYERSGLDYVPYFPDMSNGDVIHDLDIDDADAEARKNCVIS